VFRHELLKHLHQLVQPRNYLEIGVRKGASLALSRARTVAVDPFYEIEREILCDLHLVRTTSDEFFARRHPLAHFDEPVVDLAFIDGMHLSEYALRDVINVERYCHAGSVIVIDDMLPRGIEEAGRTRQGAVPRAPSGPDLPRGGHPAHRDRRADDPGPHVDRPGRRLRPPRR
jgi:predicted O-methyltransferase YrrM